MKQFILIAFFVATLITACTKPYGDGVGVYYKEGNKTDYTELKPDGTFEYYEKGRTIKGTYSVRWNTLTLHLPNGRTATGKLNPDSILDNENNRWYLKKN